MKQKLLKAMLLLCALVVGGATSVWADETSTLTFTAACGGSGTANDGAKWTVTSDGTESNFDNTKGIHYGTSSAQVKYIQLSTSDISGTITEVKVNASAASGVSASVSVSIGGSAFGGDAKSVTTSAADYTFKGSASGEIVVKLEKPSKAAKAIYIKSVAVTYSTGPSYTITAESNNTSWGTVSVSGSTITATPVDGCTYADPAYTVTLGTATVSQSGNNFTVTPSTDCTVKINFAATPIDGITLSPTSLSLSSESSTEQLTATVSPNNASFKTVTWTSSDESVATVTSEGVVNAVGSGNATITARATNGTDDTTDDYTATCAVTVSSVSYSVALADGTEDAANWSISSTTATAGQTITISYSGTRTITSVSAVKKPFGLSTFSFATPARYEHSDLAFTGASTEKPVWFTGTVDTHNTTGTVTYDHGAQAANDLLSFNGIQFYDGGWNVPGALYITDGLGTKADPFVLSTTSSPAPDMGLTTTSTGAKTWTITMPTSDVEIQVLMPYTVTLGDNNNTLTETSGGAGVTLPSRSVIGSYTFAGWSTTNETEETTTAPTIIATGEYHPTSDITLYPVYTRTEGSSAQEYTSSVTMSEYATAHSWGSSSSSGQKTVTIDENVTATCNSGTNSGKYYSDWRIYQTETGSVTISTTSGELTSVTFTFTVANTGTLKYNSSVVTSGAAVSVSGTSANFTVGNSGSATNGQVKITAISVNYTTGGGATTYYLSAPEAPAVEQPEITVAANPFLFSTTATITCDTEDATIKYSFDNETWNNYSSALTITSTTTLYAKAVKDANESTVASVAITKNLAEPTVTVSGDLTVDLNGETNVEAGTLTAAVTYNESAVDGATVAWSSSNSDIATINPSTGAVVIKTRGTVTFTATYAGNSDYAKATGTKEFTVTDSKAPGTETRPYTVAQARAAIDANEGITGVYVAGIVSQVDSYNSTYKSITYWISDDGTKTNQIKVYGGLKSQNNESGSFSNKDDLQVDDIVTICGDLLLYNYSTYEINLNNYLTSLKRKTSPELSFEQNAYVTELDGEFAAPTLSNPHELTVTYSSSVPSVATVDENTGAVTTKALGETVITANFAGNEDYKAGSANYTLTVEKNNSPLTKTSDIVLDYKNNATDADVTEFISSASTGEYTYVVADETIIENVDELISALKVGSTTITVNQAEDENYKAGSVVINVTVQDTRVDATTIPAINISTLKEGAADGTISVVDPVKADEGVTFSFASSDDDKLLIIGNAYTVGEVGTATVTVTATPSNTNLYKPVVANFDVTVQAAVMSENEITLAASTGSTIYGTPLNVNYTVAAGYDGSMSYSIANSAIADVTIGASAITFTPKAVGSTTVTISAPATGNFLAADDVIYTLTVTAPEGVTTAFEAGTAVLDFTDNRDWGFPEGSSNKTTGKNQYTSNGYTITLDASSNGYYYNTTDKYLLMGQSGTTLTLPAFDNAVTKIDVTGRSAASGKVTQNIFVGSTAVSEQTTGATGKNEYEIDPDYQAAGNIYSLEVTSAHNTQITSITVHFKGITAKLNASGYATFCSEYPLDFSDYETADYSAWQITGVSGTNILFEQITGSVKGGTGIFLKGEAGETVTLTSTDSENVLAGNKLFGTTAPTFVGADEYYGLKADEFKKVNAGTVPAGKALLPMSADVKSFTFVFNGADGIQRVEKVSAAEAEAIFNLAGQRIQKPQRGINIVNGRKVVVK